MDANTLIAYLAENWTWALGLGASMFGLTVYAGLLNPARKEDLALWLMGAQTEEGWSRSFISLFDAVFGSNHFSIRCFVRSTIATLIAVIVIWLLMGSVDVIGVRMQSELALGSVLVIGLMINVIADYVSLLETRWLLGNMPRN
ncbi:hypothetical protein, partial [Ruegeria sp. HKCCD8929]|uniref:hypothetical protein n=1 Tax=Ruegeria sp. HKCCD8929 TaxID=2683006 RepID=UPI0014885939